MTKTYSTRSSLKPREQDLLPPCGNRVMYASFIVPPLEATDGFPIAFPKGCMCHSSSSMFYRLLNQPMLLPFDHILCRSGLSEEFETKQANIFTALEKLFMLQNALLAKSRFLKAFLFYSCVIFLLYMLTSAEQTFAIRARLYLAVQLLGKMIKIICHCSSGGVDWHKISIQSAWIGRWGHPSASNPLGGYARFSLFQL
ncbi:hypothetical protein KSP40_PGU000854 [Platanthera guangdongensis]|uniref:Uncharacterized protein n=1 Tax=Platanthera guangdongensis TaxID=2320717 RepID=A0ABR2MW42_9ASPA